MFLEEGLGFSVSIKRVWGLGLGFLNEDLGFRVFLKRV